MSNSVILKNILDDESSELRQDIISFMESKVNEFSFIMKSNIEKAITQKIDDFYKKKFDDVDSILFDKDGTDIVKKAISWLETMMSSCYQNPIGRQNIQKQINDLKQFARTDGYKCFILNSSHYTGNGYDTNAIYIFKHVMITNARPAGSNHNDPDRPNYCKHNLPNDILFTIKHFQIPRSTGFEPSLKIYDEHPEYFNTNCCEFETICKRERQLMDKQKETLEDLIKQNTNNIEYYKTLETQIREVESEKEKVQQEYKKIKEEKEKMRIVKQKLAAMKVELEREKREFEEQKHKIKVEALDIDKYFENEESVVEGEGDNIQ
jgi:hypothetical protein